MLQNEKPTKKPHLDRTGIKHTKKTKEKMRLAQTGEKNHFYGKRHSDITKRKLHEIKQGKPSGFWRGGNINFWKRQALTRDDHTCQQCGLREPGIMDVDHILPKSVAPKLKNSLENLITLCPNDHRRKTNNDRKRYNWKRKYN